MHVERVLASRAQVGEGAIWSAAEATLYWVDIVARELHRYDPAGGVDQIWTLPSEVGCCAPLDDGRVLVALEEGFTLFDPTGESTELLGCPGDMPAASRFNDGTVDPRGRFLAGTLPKAGAGAEPLGKLYVLDGRAQVRCLEQRDFLIQNGLAFGPDGRTLYVSDSGPAVQAVWRYSYDPDNGMCSERRLYFDMRSARGRPDGAAMDVDGCYWIAAVDGWSLLRLTPAGEVDRVIELPVQKPSKPAFGGADMRTLYVTSISAGLDLNDPVHAEAGNLFALDVGVEGMPVGPVDSGLLAAARGCPES